MREALKVFKRFIFKYKGYLSTNIIFNILGAIFGIFSFVTLIPLLKVLFQVEKTIYTYKEIVFSVKDFDEFRNSLMNNIYYYTNQMIEKEGAVYTLVSIAIIGGFMVLFKTGFTYVGEFTMNKIRNHVVKDIRNKIYRKIISLPIGYFNEERKGDIITRATLDITEIEVSIMSSLNMLFKNPMLILFSLITMIVMSPKLTLFVFIFFPIAGGLTGFIGKTLRKKSMKGQNKIGEILSIIEETLGGLRIVKAFNAEDKMFEKQSKQNHQYRKIMDTLMNRNSLASPMSEFLGTVAILVIMIFGGTLILNGKNTLDAEQFLVYLILCYSIINPIKSFSTSYYRVQKGLASLDRIDALLNAKSNIGIKENTLPINGFKTAVEYRNVSFKYIDEYVLENIELTLEKGKTVALVGQSGSGKSTMADLLPRFYDVNKGSVLVDGTDIRDLNPTELRNLMGIVSQEAILFNDTIYNNIAFGVKEATMQEVENAAKIANAHEFILQTEKGYQTNIGDRGNRLSGGQRQRISIARAVLTNPPILILDEATSALDTESERLVQDALNKLMKSRTSLVIAHRLSTIRNADMIHVLREGKIIESGNYDELISRGGEFKKLHDIQFGE
jgi:subfamily B ATP-binding cassette protein MsbA